jgi:hypothetical protein
MEKRRSLPQSSRRVTFLAARFACSDRTKAETTPLVGWISDILYGTIDNPRQVIGA